jgi:transcriptional regulator with XRE-family HTH domain
MKALKKMREQLGLTQAQLASAFGVSRNALAHAEAGNSMLDGRAAQRFAQMLAASQQALAAVQQPQAEMPEGEITHLMALRKHKLTALQAQLHTMQTRAQQATQLLHTAATLASTPDDVEAQFYQALQRGDIEGLMAVWADDDEIVCVHPGGPRVVGPQAIRASFEAIFANGGVPAQPGQVHRLHWLGGALHHLVERIDLRTSEGPQTA